MRGVVYRMAAEAAKPVRDVGGRYEIELVVVLAALLGFGCGVAVLGFCALAL